MRRVVFGLLAIGTLCSLNSRALAVEPGPACESGKLVAAAKYAQCRLMAEAKSVKTGDPVDYFKCNLGKFPLHEEKAGTGVCPTEDDQTTVRAHLDECTSLTKLWLDGDGGLPEPKGRVKNTGQTACYDTAGNVVGCAGTGQDGEVQAGLPSSFTDNGDGTITDENTGLMWEKLSDDGSIHDKDTAFTWADAFATKIATLNSGSFAGYNDWRVPSVTELQSLPNYSALEPSVYPEFDTGCLPGCTVTTCSCTKDDYYWTSTTLLSYPQIARVVSFIDAASGGVSKPGSFPVRAVRAGL